MRKVVFLVFPLLQNHASANKALDKYRSPVSASSATIILPAASARDATFNATHSAAPDDPPATTPSRVASRHAHANAPSSVTAITLSRISRLSVSGFDSQG